MKKLGIFIIVILSIGIVSYTGCSHSVSSEIVGTVSYIKLDGGFWGIIGNDGKKYEPVNLDSKYRTDAQLVCLRAEILADRAGSHQWGTPIKIISIELVTTNC